MQYSLYRYYCTNTTLHTQPYRMLMNGTSSGTLRSKFCLSMRTCCTVRVLTNDRTSHRNIASKSSSPPSPSFYSMCHSPPLLVLPSPTVFWGRASIHLLSHLVIKTKKEEKKSRLNCPSLSPPHIAQSPQSIFSKQVRTTVPNSPPCHLGVNILPRQSVLMQSLSPFWQKLQKMG